MATVLGTVSPMFERISEKDLLSSRGDGTVKRECGRSCIWTVKIPLEIKFEFLLWFSAVAHHTHHSNIDYHLLLSRPQQCKVKVWFFFIFLCTLLIFSSSLLITECAVTVKAQYPYFVQHRDIKLCLSVLDKSGQWILPLVSVLNDTLLKDVCWKGLHVSSLTQTRLLKKMQVLHWPLGADYKSESISIDLHVKMSNFAAETNINIKYSQPGCVEDKQFNTTCNPGHHPWAPYSMTVFWYQASAKPSTSF